MVSGRNRHATHPVNAMLNYAYAVLESQVRIATVSQGLDPTIGYLHMCRPGRAALVHDLPAGGEPRRVAHLPPGPGRPRA
jgi:CRISPR-associated protein Cas1